MRNLMSIAEIFAYGNAVYVLANGDGKAYWVFFGIGLAISFIKKFFK